MTTTPNRTPQTGRSPRRRPVTPEDLLKFQLLSDPQISPDGSRIVFVEKHVSDKNEYVSNLWIVPTGGGESCKFTDGGKDSSPRWSPCGRRIAFVREAKKGCPQIYTIAAAGGEAAPLTDFPEGSMGALRWSPNGKWLAVSFRRRDPQRTEKAKKQRKEKGLSDPPLVVDTSWYRLDGDGYFGNERHHLYLVDAESGQCRDLYAEDTLGFFTFDFSPNSRELIVSTIRNPHPTVYPWKEELVRVRVADGKVTPLGGLPAGPKTCVRWSPDGKTIAYAGRIGTDGAYSVENLELFVCRPTGRGVRSLTAAEDYCLMAGALTDTADASFDPAIEFSPDGSRIYMRLGACGQAHVASAPSGGGRLTFHTRGKLDQQMGNLSADGAKMALAVGKTTRPAEVAVADCTAQPFKTKRLTNLNGPLLAEIELVRPESHWIKADDGHKVQVWVVKPPGVKAGRKAPAVLEIHGGPHAQYGSGLFHEFQVLAAAGYVVVYSNPRGSKGYGRDHCAAIRGHWGTADWTDIQAVIRFMKELPMVDHRRMGVMGGSYGGYMTNWVITHCRDFAAAVTDRCVSNLVSMSGNTDFLEKPDDYFPGNFWDQAEARWDQSPMKYMGDVKTPTLIIHSEGDLRCNIEQAEQVHAALVLLGVPVRLVRYPRSTSHGMSRMGPPDLRIHRLKEILAWWARYLK